jgi:putative membrane protein
MAVRWFSSGAQTKQEPQDALEILKSRFANGELDEEQYRKRKSVLEE